MRFLFVASCALMVITPAVASERPSASESDRVVCRDMLRTGSRFTSRTCRTVAEWEKITEESRKAAHEAFDRPLMNKPNDQ